MNLQHAALDAADLEILALDISEILDKDHRLDVDPTDIRRELPALLARLGIGLHPSAVTSPTPDNDASPSPSAEPAPAFNTPWHNLSLDALTAMATERRLPPISTAQLGPDNVAAIVVADLRAVFCWARSLGAPMVARRGYAVTVYTSGELEARIIAAQPHVRDFDAGADGALLHTCNANDPGKPLPWGRRDPDHKCARCAELDSGAPRRPKPAWVERLERIDKADAAQRAAIKAHFARGGPHERGECGPVCTAFDW